MNLFRKFVSEHAWLFQGGKKLPLGSPKKFPWHPKVPDNAPKALIFSPHPDDECIVGGLALRLLREAKWNVVNVAVTLGGKKRASGGASPRIEKRLCLPWLCLGFRESGQRQSGGAVEKPAALEGSGQGSRENSCRTSAPRDFSSARLRRPRHTHGHAFIGSGRA